jgi:hypothetical protein
MLSNSALPPLRGGRNTYRRQSLTHLQPTKRLVNEALEVSVRKRLTGTDNGVKVRLHAFFIEVDAVEVDRVDEVEVVEAGDL